MSKIKHYQWMNVMEFYARKKNPMLHNNYHVSNTKLIIVQQTNMIDYTPPIKLQ
jgi:hypothetical protein